MTGASSTNGDKFANAAPCLSTGHLTSTFDTRLQDKLDAIERIRGDLTAEKIDVPGVVVIGNQSAGKSSVLESLSGINFPRGENTCTRRPCIVQMERNPHQSQPYAFVADSPHFENAENITSFDDIGPEINRLTKSIAGPGTTIHPDPIHVKVCRSSGPTLTLIDLPGITHVHETQKDIHDVIVAMIRKFISNKQMVILTVVPAVDDFGNCEALNLAKEVDPDGTRTLGVVTKVDTIPKDSDLVQKLRAERHSDIKLKLGWIAVRCRSPTEIKNKVSLDDMVDIERQFFATHLLLKDLTPRHFSMETLVNRLVDIQAEAVDAWFPLVKMELQKRIFLLRDELAFMAPPCVDDADKMSRFMTIVCEVDRELLSLVQATDVEDDKELHVSARVYEMMLDLKNDVSAGVPDFLSDTYIQIVEEQVKESMGSSLPNFLSQSAFKKLVLGVFAPLLGKSADKLVDNVRMYMIKVLHKLIEQKAEDFAKLVPGLQSAATDLVRDQEEEAKLHVRAAVDAEKLVFTMDASYVELFEKVMQLVSDYRKNLIQRALGRDAMSTEQVGLVCAALNAPEIKPEFLERVTKATEDPERMRVWQKQLSLFIYAKVVQRRFCDNVCLLVKRSLVHLVQERFVPTMNKVFGIEQLRASMEQDAHTRALREEKATSVKRLEDSLRTIEKVG